MNVKGKQDTAAKRRAGTISKDASGRVAQFEATPEQAKQVRSLAGIGCTNEEILQVVPWGRPDDLPIDEKTLLKYFKTELVRGRSLAAMNLKKRAYDMAAEGDRTMLIFLMKTKYGYSETVKVEQTGKDGAPLPVAVAGPILYLPAKDPDPHLPPAPTGASTEEVP